MSAALSVGLGFVARALWPERCVACKALTEPGAPFCAPCAAGVTRIDNACRVCGGALLLGAPRSAAGGPGSGCRDCARTPFPFSRAESVFLYGGTIARAIVALKHAGRLWAAAPLGRCLAPVLCGALGEGEGDDFIVPVPLHPRRLRQRGYNQALELIRAARPSWRPRHGPRAHLLVDTLRRIRDTPALGHEPLARRQARLHAAFRVADPERVVDRRVILVDDVMTTGATLSACARALLEAGAAEVRAVALARAQ